MLWEIKIAALKRLMAVPVIGVTGQGKHLMTGLPSISVVAPFKASSFVPCTAQADSDLRQGLQLQGSGATGVA